MSKGFKLIAEQMNPAKSESVIVSQTMNYLNTLRARGVQAWINEEHPGPYNRSHPQRRRGSDIQGIVSPSGRFLAFEMKTEQDYKYLMGHYEKFKSRTHYKGSKWQHFGDQIEYVEMIQQHGGIGMFACSWEQVRDRLRAEGIDHVA